MAETKEQTDNRRHLTDQTAAPPIARVRDDDLEPHEGLRYVAKLFKALALLLMFMLIAEIIIGLRQDGMAALGMLMVEATRLIVFAGFLWGAGDMAVLLIESNHDLRAARILLGRLNGRVERAFPGDIAPAESVDDGTHDPGHTPALPLPPRRDRHRD
ncbi:hypothetical protein BH23GEM9_BH23GEM9_06000 [soil metagenome]